MSKCHRNRHGYQLTGRRLKPPLRSELSVSVFVDHGFSLTQIDSKRQPKDDKSHEQTQETMALLKILALGMHQIENGKTQPAKEVLQRLRSRHQAS